MINKNQLTKIIHGAIRAARADHPKAEEKDLAISIAKRITGTLLPYLTDGEESLAHPRQYKLEDGGIDPSLAVPNSSSSPTGGPSGRPGDDTEIEKMMNPLSAPAIYQLSTLLRELKFGRTAADQHLLAKWIDEAEEGEATGENGAFDLPPEADA